MARPRIISIITLAAVVAFLAFRRSGNEDGEVFPPPDPVLSRVVLQCDFDRTRLDRAFQTLSEVTGVPIEVNWAKLVSGGISPNDEVTARMNGHSLKWALSVLRITVEGKKAQLGYRVKNGRITVSAQSDLPSGQTCRMYSVGDLIDGSRRWLPYDEINRSERMHIVRRVLVQELPEDDPWGDRIKLDVISDRLLIRASPEQQAVFTVMLDQMRHHTMPSPPPPWFREK